MPWLLRVVFSASAGDCCWGRGFWEREPSGAQLAAMSIPAGQYRSLADLVERTASHGFRPLWITQAGLDEWDAFESGHPLCWERWLAANPQSPHPGEIAARADAHRKAWLHGWRATMGFTNLTLTTC